MFGLVQQSLLVSFGIEYPEIKIHPLYRSLKVTAGVALQGGSTDPWLYILRLSRLKAIHGHSIEIEQNMSAKWNCYTMSIQVGQFSQA